MKDTYRAEFKSIKSQKGWTFWSLLFTLGVILFVAYIAMQLVPVYTNNSSVTSAMNQTLDEVDLYKATRRGIIIKMRDQLYVDGNDDLLNYKTDLKVKRSKTDFVLSTTYDREIPLFFNISMLVKFDNVVERDLNR